MTELVVQKIIYNLLVGDDYRINVLVLINADFLKFAIEFFKKIVEAKFRDQDLDFDWYKRNFVENPSLDIDERVYYAGLNVKTIQNMKESTARQVKIDASTENYDQLYETIDALVKDENEVDLTLTIKFKKLSVDLTLNESLLVINALAVKRAALTGGYWSKAGKRVETPLMHTLCKLYQVPENYYSLLPDGRFYRNIEISRQIDFYLNNGEGTFYKCEVKLMGKGNPESADVTYARDTRILVADTLSRKNITQLNDERVEWIQLRSSTEGYKRFSTVLGHLDIPHIDFDGNLEERLEEIFSDIFN